MLLLQINTTACDGSDLFWSWFMWLLGAFIIGLILGWLLKQLFGGSGDTTDYTAKIKGLESELDACRKEKSKLAAGAAATVASFAAAKVDDSVKDDLTKVEGIGPKIKGLLNDDGIWSFKQLSEAAVSRLQKILDDAGPRYRVHNPKTWADQAKMATEGKWDELKKWQDELKGGL
jgi:predicted flap endonuclease-1-like 5' DNA nuclease